MKKDKFFRGSQPGEQRFFPIKSSISNECLDVLVVEDDPDVSSLIQMAIHAWGLPLDVEFVQDGYSAIRSVMKHKPDVMILDLRLPKLDGYSIMQGLVKQGNEITFIVVTGLSESDVYAIGDLPQNAYLMQKPIDLKRFRKILEKLIDEMMFSRLIQQ
ncbi:two-component system, LytT family, response regulator LytT [Mariprofundus aestuarium]|uniref:Two-component system, LytT family, response regulator LytT n=1 Tax=Mariprofundus aestuarium TaxID=1921086 RepID=A0A2K8KXS2_MARES|nr:response regulator [Mariprofundus aestuarium]ATX79522.1 two-component system, LytT family, response regulator LytT [Mariprofundus aestuarium]